MARREGFDARYSGGAGRPNAGRSRRSGGRTDALLLEGHTDVVTEGDPAQWSHPPFGADLLDGRIYGRGAADMKSGLAAAMVAAAVLKRSGARLGGRLVVGALVDEEGDMLGAKHLVRTPLGRELTAAIICEQERTSSARAARRGVGARDRARPYGARGDAGGRVNPISALAA